MAVLCPHDEWSSKGILDDLPRFLPSHNAASPTAELLCPHDEWSSKGILYDLPRSLPSHSAASPTAASSLKTSTAFSTVSTACDFSESDRQTYAERMQRWKNRKEERKRKKQELQGKYGQLTTHAFRSKHDTGKLACALLASGLQIGDLKFIGAGTFARVFMSDMCVDGSSTPVPVALKCIRGRHSRPYRSSGGTLHRPKWMEREIAASKDHPNIVRSLGVHADTYPCVFVLEYCAGGSLHEAIYRNNDGPMAGQPLSRLTWPQTHKIAVDVARGMAYLHAQMMLHRDLKPLNILMAERITSESQRPHAKVGDFGLVKIIGKGSTASPQTFDVGSRIYMAPEVFACSEHADYGNMVDVYSYAVTLFEMLTSTPPFHEYIEKFGSLRLGLFVVRGGRPECTKMPEDAPEQLRLVMVKSWAECPSERPNFDDILEEFAKSSSGCISTQQNVLEKPESMAEES